jgi:RNA polymerase sigma factor for flagellar operon FliA
MRAGVVNGQRIAVRNELMSRHMPLLETIASKAFAHYAGQVELNDLRSDGVFGLAEAVDSFQPARGIKFSTYGYQRIHGAMVDGVRSRDWVPRLERQRAKQGLVNVRAMGSLESPVFDTHRGVRPLGDQLPDPTGGAMSRSLEARESIRRLIVGLPRRQRAAMLMYFEQDLTMKEIGKALGLCESRISQLISGALLELRARFSAEVN